MRNEFTMRNLGTGAITYNGQTIPQKPVTSQLTAIESGIDNLLQSHAALEKQQEKIADEQARWHEHINERLADFRESQNSALAGLAERLEAIERYLERNYRNSSQSVELTIDQGHRIDAIERLLIEKQFEFKQPKSKKRKRK